MTPEDLHTIAGLPVLDAAAAVLAAELWPELEQYLADQEPRP